VTTGPTQVPAATGPNNSLDQFASALATNLAVSVALSPNLASTGHALGTRLFPNPTADPGPLISTTYLYVSDIGTTSKQVWRYTIGGASDGVWDSTWKLNGPTLPDVPTGIAWNGTYLYVADEGASQILRYNSAGTFDKVFVPSGQTYSPSAPYGLAWGANDGNLYVAGPGKVYRYKPDGTAYPSARNGGAILNKSTLLGNPYGITTDTSGNVYVGDLSNVTVVKITPDGQSASVYARPNGTGSPQGVWFGPVSNSGLYFTLDRSAVDKTDGTTTTTFTADTHLNNAIGLVWSGTTWYVCNFGGGNINTYSTVDGSTIKDGWNHAAAGQTDPLKSPFFDVTQTT
jgi:hypothetical protein